MREKEKSEEEKVESGEEAMNGEKWEGMKERQEMKRMMKREEFPGDKFWIEKEKECIFKYTQSG